MRRYMFSEAYRLMQYQDKVTGDIEWVWNSRDGVTPFMIRSPKGNEAQHINWSEDKRVPHYVPDEGDRIFVNLDMHAAMPIAESVVDRDWDHPDYPMRKAYSSKKQAIEELAKGYVGDRGQPHLVVVDTQMKRHFERVAGRPSS